MLVIVGEKGSKFKWSGAERTSEVGSQGQAMESQGKGVKDDSRTPSLSDWYDGGSGDRHGRVRRSHVWEKKGNTYVYHIKYPISWKRDCYVERRPGDTATGDTSAVCALGGAVMLDFDGNDGLWSGATWRCCVGWMLTSVKKKPHAVWAFASVWLGLIMVSLLPLLLPVGSFWTKIIRKITSVDSISS